MAIRKTPVGGMTGHFRARCSVPGCPCRGNAGAFICNWSRSASLARTVVRWPERLSVRDLSPDSFRDLLGPRTVAREHSLQAALQ